MYEVNKLPLTLPLSPSGTNRQVVEEFDVSAWLEDYPGDLYITVCAIRPGETKDDAYFGDTVMEDGILRWTIHYADTEKIGTGYAEIHGYIEGEDTPYIKSSTMITNIPESIADTAGDIPEPAEPWTARVEAAAAVVETARVHPAIVGANGNWWIWDQDSEEYTDSGKPSRGENGSDGEDGEDGFSPIVAVTDITSGHRVSITDKTETHVFDVMNGEDGEDGDPGSPGADGVSPTITVETIMGGHKITITDAEGTQTVDVMDGVDGQDGDDGRGISNTVLNSDYTLTINYTDGTSVTTGSIRGQQGEQGVPGAKGDPGDDAPQIDDTQATSDHPFSGQKVANLVSAHTNRTDNPHSVTAEQTAYNASGTHTEGSVAAELSAQSNPIAH